MTFDSNVRFDRKTKDLDRIFNVFEFLLVNMETRKSDSLTFKKTVFKTLDENNGNISATSKTCCVDRKNIRRWKKQRTAIEKACQTKVLKSRSKRRIRAMKARFALLEDALVEYVKEERGKHQTVTRKMIRRKAATLFQTLNESHG